MEITRLSYVSSCNCVSQRPVRNLDVRRLRCLASTSRDRRSIGALDSTCCGRRRSLLFGTALLIPAFAPKEGMALGLESITLPFPAAPTGPSPQQSKLADAEAAFAESDLVKQLRERSDQNRDKYKKELANKYCFRQAEMGVGDCAGLQLIPGMTRSGKQKTPGWLAKLLGAEEDTSPVPIPKPMFSEED